MSLGKRDISKNISSKTRITSKDSLKILNKFIEVISTQSNNKNIKISNFGTFYKHTSPKRLGRNPKTKKEYIIPQRSKIAFKASKNIKNFIN